MKGLGFNEEQIKQVEALTPEQMTAWAAKQDDPENLKLFNPGELVKTVQEGMKNVLSNDATFLANIPKDKINPTILKEIEKGQYARFQNELIEVATKKLGLEDKELTEEDRKSIKGLAEKMAVTYLTKKGNVEGLKEMQGKLSETMQAMEALKTSNAETLQKELEKVNGSHSAKLIKILTKVELAGLPDVQLTVGPSFISDAVLTALSSKYAVVLSEDGESLDIKQKDNPKLDVLGSNGKKIGFQEALKEIVITNKLGAEVKADPNDPLKKRKVVIGGGGSGDDDDVNDVVDSHIMKKIEANK